ncbi:MAG: hypothetical protein U0528_14075 [Anaerolineae bacterium]
MNVLRLPPLVISKEALEQAAQQIEAVIEDYRSCPRRKTRC